MKKYVLVGFFSVVLIAAASRLISGMSKEATALKLASLPEVQALEKDKVKLERAEIALQMAKLKNSYQMIPVKNRIYFVGIVGVLSAGCLSGLILAVYFGHAKLREKSLVDQQVGSSVLKVHYRAVKRPDFLIYVSQVNEIEAIRAQFPEKALQMSLALSSAITQQMKAIAGRRGILSEAVSENSQIGTSAISDHVTPSIADLLRDGSIDANKPLVFGYAGGKPIVGTWQDLFSCGIGGKSGSGKTSTLRSIICQSVLQGCQFYLIDPHFPHDESLQASIISLVKTGHVKVDLACNTLKIINDTIDRRLRKEETSIVPVILVIDEVLNVIPNCKGTAETILKIGTEGRKCKVYGLFSGHSWLANKTGGDSSVRDNLTAIFAHNMKPKQAQAFLQDKTLTHQVNHLRTGQALFSSTNSDPVVLTVPFCSVTDVQKVATFVGQRAVNSLTVDQVIDYAIDQPLTSKNQGVDLVDQLNLFIKKSGQERGKQKELAERIGVDPGFFSKILRRQKPMPKDVIERTERILIEVHA